MVESRLNLTNTSLPINNFLDISSKDMIQGPVSATGFYDFGISCRFPSPGV